MKENKKLTWQEKSKRKRKQLIQYRLDRIAYLIAETTHLLRMDYPQGALFVEGEGGIYALTNSDSSVRENCILANSRFPKQDCGCGAW